MKRMLANNEKLTQWVNEYTDEMFSWAFHKTSDAELASDLVQDTFLAASEKIETFKGDSSPKTWLFSILNFKIIDVYRAKAKQPIAMDEQSAERFFTQDEDWISEKRPALWDADEHLLDDHNFNAVLDDCMKNLPKQWGAIMHMKFLGEKKGKEICKDLAITTTNYWQVVHRAKLQLRECIEFNWFKKEL